MRLIASLMLFLAALPAFAGTVASTDDSGAGSLRQAIADAKPGDTITFGVKGTIALTSGELVIDKDLTITGPGSSALTISGGQKDRVLSIKSGTVTISGLAIKDGKAAGSPARGGGIQNNGTLTLRQVTVSGNQAIGDSSQAAYGGGIYNNGTMTIVGSMVSGNSAKGGNGSSGGNGARGGGICAVGALTVSGSTIAGNTATGGNTTGPGRAGDGEGGGLFCYNNCAVVVDGTTIAGNKAVSGNASHDKGIGGYASGGGVIQNWGGGTGTRLFTNCTISGNSTQGGSGGMADSCSRGGGAWETATSKFVHCTITKNKTSGRFQEGGGVYSATSSGDGPALQNCIVTGNTAVSGPDLRGAVQSLDYNLIGSVNGCTLSGSVAQNIVGQDAKLGALAGNGGPSQTHAVGAGSAAIDKIPPEACPVKTDQRGTARPQGPACDIGAYEVDKTAPKATAIAPSEQIVAPGKPISFTVTFDKDVKGFNAEADLAVVKKGSLSYASVAIGGGPRTYTVTFDGVKGDGSLALAVNTKSDVLDLSGMPLESSVTSAPAAVDSSAPTATAIVSTTPSPTNAKTVAFAVSFSEPVQRFTQAVDVILTETGTVKHTGVRIAGGPQHYTVEIGGLSGEGTIAMAVNTKTGIKDLVGTPIALSVTSDPVALDTTPPTVALSPATPATVVAHAAVFNVVFSEPVAPTFTAEDIALTGTLASDATVQIGGTDPAYTVTIAPKDPGVGGTIAIDVGTTVADLAGNALTSGVISPLITIDSTPPSLTLEAKTPPVSNAPAVDFAATFSEPVAPTFTAEDVALTGTLASAATVQIGGTDPAYTLTATPNDPAAGGTLGVLVNTAVSDAAGNALAAAVSSPLVTLDHTPPAATVTLAAREPNSPTVVFDIQFSEPVEPPLAMDNVALTGTMASAATAQLGGSGTAYTVTVTPNTSNANETVGIVVSGAKDAAGNVMTAPAASPVTTMDTTPPVATIDRISGSPTSATSAVFSVEFSEPVAPTFTENTVTLSGDLAAACTFRITGTDPKYFVTVTPKDPKASGTIGVVVGEVKDTAGNALVGPVQGPLVTLDHAPLGIAIERRTPSPTQEGVATFDLAFSKPAAATFSLANLSLTGTLATTATMQLSGSDPKYAVQTTLNDPKANGTLALIVDADLRDLAGNAPAAKTVGPEAVFDHVPPTLALSLAAPAVTRADSVVFNAVFSEPVAPTFTLEDIALTGTLASAATAQLGGTDPSYRVEVTPNNPNANGTIGIVVSAGVTDLAGNAMASGASSPLATIDNTAPSAIILLLTTNLSGAGTVEFGVSFTKPVAPTFTAEDVTLAGTLAKIATFAVEGTDPDYKVTVTLSDPNAKGTIGLSIGGAIADTAGNPCSGTASVLCTK